MSTLFAYGNMLCANMKIYLYNHFKWVESSMNIHEGKGEYKKHYKI